MTTLEKRLFRLLPLGHISSTAGRHIRIMRAIDLIATDRKGVNAVLTPLEQKLARGFVGLAVDEFVTSTIIWWSARSNPNQTSLVECGEHLNVETASSALDPDVHRGLGISLWKADRTPVLKPFVDEMIGHVFDGDTLALPSTNALDTLLPEEKREELPPSHQPLLGRIISLSLRLIARVSPSTMKRLHEKSAEAHSKFMRGNALRLLIYVTPPESVLAKARVLARSADTYGQGIVQAAYQRVLQASKPTDKMLDAVDFETSYIIRGKAAQDDPEVVNELLAELATPTISPPEKMRTVNALLIASRKCERAMTAYLEAKTTPEHYGYDVPEEYFLMKEHLEPLEERPFAILFDAICSAATVTPNQAQNGLTRVAIEYMRHVEDLNGFAQLLLQTKLDEGSIAERIAASFIILQNSTWTRRHQTKFADLFLHIVQDPQSKLVSPRELRQFPGSEGTEQSLRDIAISGVLALAFSNASGRQPEIILRLLDTIKRSDDELKAKIDNLRQEAGDEDEVLQAKILTAIFGEHADQAHDLLHTWHPTLLRDYGARVLPQLLFEDSYTGQHLVLQQLYMQYKFQRQSLHPDVEAVLTELVQERYEFFEGLHRVVRSDFAEGVGLFEKFHARLHATSTQPKRVEASSSGQDFPPLDGVTVIDSPPLVKEIILAPDLPREYLDKIFAGIAKKSLDEEIRAHLISCLSLRDDTVFVNDTLAFLGELLQGGSAEVVTASLLTIGELLKQGGESELKFTLLKLIDVRCVPRTPRNSKVVYPFYSKGDQVWQPTRVDEVAHMVLYSFGREVLQVTG